MRPSNSEYARGAIYGLAAICIWAGFIVVSRLGVKTSVTPWDVAAIRFGVAGSLLLPYLLRRGLAFDRLSWTGIAAVVMGCGAPMVLLVNVVVASDPIARRLGRLIHGLTQLLWTIAPNALRLLRHWTKTERSCEDSCRRALSSAHSDSKHRVP